MNSQRTPTANQSAQQDGVVRSRSGGRQRPSGEQVAQSQRRRLLDAMAHLCAEKGYHGVTIAELVARAGISRATYYELFEDKQQLFVATLEEALERLRAAILPVALESSGTWSERVRDVVAALLDHIANEPDYAKSAILESLSGGEEAFRRYTAGVSMLVKLIDQGRSELSPEARLPRRTARTVLGASEWLIVSEMIADRIERVPELLPDIVYMTLLPYVGQGEALRQMREAVHSRGS